MQISVVVPSYNEAEGIDALLCSISDALEGMDHEIIVVDDDSPDGTAEVVLAAASRSPRIRLIRRVGVRGLATAVIAGMQAARGAFVAVIDADGQHPPSLLPRLVDAAREADAPLAIASRHAPGGSDAAFTGARRAISHGAIAASRLALPTVRRCRVRDPVSGYFVVRRDALPDLATLDPKGYKILLEIIVAMDPPRVVEVPFRFEARQAGASKLRSRVMAQFVSHLASLAARDRANRRLASFLAVGASGVLVNLVPLVLAQAMGLGALALFGVSLAARELAVMWNFALNDAVTFRERRSGRPLGSRIARWHLVTLAGTGVYVVVDAALLAMGASAVVSGSAAILAGVAANWSGAEKWAYKEPPAEPVVRLVPNGPLAPRP